MAEKSDEKAKNPLLNPIVPDKMLKNLDSVEHPKETRQVCKKRFCETNGRAFITVKLGPAATTTKKAVASSSSSSTSSSNQNDIEYWSVDEYWQRFQSPKDEHEFASRPYTKYIISGINLTTCSVLHLSPPLEDNEEDANGEEEPAEARQRKYFWETVGPHITFLKFENCTFSGEQPELFEQLVTDKLPNLEALFLSDSIISPKRSFSVDKHIMDVNQTRIVTDKPNEAVNIYRSNMKRSENLKTLEIKGETPMSLYMLLLNSPNIESLKLDQDLAKEHVYAEAMDTLFILTRPVVDGIPFQIKHLDIMGARFFKSWPNVVVLPILESFTVTISPSKCSSKSDKVPIPLVLQHENVRVWKVFHPPVFPARFSQKVFPSRLPALKELYLYGNIVKDLDFLVQLPSLEILHIDYHCYDKVKMMYNLFDDKMYVRKAYKPLKEYGKMITKSRGENQEPLGNMQKCYLDMSLEPKLIKILAGWIPNLRCLEINLSADNEFWTICKYLPNLEELGFLFDSRVDDNMLTGLDGKRKERHSENITTFKNLKKFQLKQRCHGIHKKYRLGSKSVYEGFLKIDTLHCVNICASEEMTVEAEAALKMHVADVSVIRNYDASIPHGDGECCRIKFAETSLSAKRVTDE